jgi:hypothetical protein
MKKHEDAPAAKKPELAKGEVDIAADEAPAAEPTWTGAAPAPSTTPDPNQDTARQIAIDTYNQKLAAGEPVGEKPPGPVALSNKPRDIPTGPVAAGYRRVRVTSPVMVGSTTHEAGAIVDISESDADSLGANVEVFESAPHGESTKKSAKK